VALISEATVAQVRERTDLAALVGEYVGLKRSGASLKGLCPFHSEKSPSFYVHPERGFFHCFGCQASGDAFAFLMRLEGLSFPEALRRLADRAGVTLEEESGPEDRAARRARARREQLYGLVEAAAGFYVRMLAEHPHAHRATEELERRAMSPETVARYRLGYAPSEWDGLARFLAERGYAARDAEEVGLLVRRRSGSGHYDRFRHRLMFPVSDLRGRIVAFSGRALEPPAGQEPPPEKPAKYINSPETPIYTKGDIVFGLHEARVAARRADSVILCEGNFDVLALAQAGLENVGAPLGTALTAEQAKALRRYGSRVTLLFDADAAGRKATRAAFPLLAEAGLGAQVVTLPPGEDPDSFLRSKGVEAMQRLVDNAPPIVEAIIESAATEAGRDPRGKATAIEALGPVLAKVDNPVERQLYLERVASAFGLRDLEAVRRQLRRGLRGGPRRRRPAPPEDGPPPPPPPPPFRPPPLQADLLGAFLDAPILFRDALATEVERVLTAPVLRAIFTRASEVVRTVPRTMDAETSWHRSGASAADESEGAAAAEGSPNGVGALAGEAGDDHVDGGPVDLTASGSAFLPSVDEVPVDVTPRVVIDPMDLLAEHGLLGEIDPGARSWMEQRMARPSFEDEGEARSFVERTLPIAWKKQAQRLMKGLDREILAARRTGDDARAELLTRHKNELYRSAGRFGVGSIKG
jgi:DNA primase